MLLTGRAVDSEVRGLIRLEKTYCGRYLSTNFVNMLIKYQSYYTKSYQNLSVLKFLKMRVSTEQCESTRSERVFIVMNTNE